MINKRYPVSKLILLVCLCMVMLAAVLYARPVLANQNSGNLTPGLSEDEKTAWRQLRSQASQGKAPKLTESDHALIRQTSKSLSELQRGHIYLSGRIKSADGERLGGVRFLISIATGSGLIPGNRPRVERLSSDDKGIFQSSIEGSSASIAIIKDGYYSEQIEVSGLPQIDMTPEWIERHLGNDQIMKPFDAAILGIEIKMQEIGETTTLDFRLGTLVFTDGISVNVWHYDPDDRSEKLKNGKYSKAGIIPLDDEKEPGDAGITLNCMTNPDGTIQTVTLPMKEGRYKVAMPTEVSLKAIDEHSGFIPIGFSDQPDRMISRTYRKAPAEGYASEIKFEPEDIRRMYQDKYWFYIKSGKYYGRGYIIVRPGDPNGVPSVKEPYTDCRAAIYLAMQPNGSLNLETGE